MAHRYKELYEAATRLSAAVVNFETRYTELLDDAHSRVFNNDVIDEAVPHMTALTDQLIREVVADAFDEGVLDFVAEEEPTEGAENVHKNDNLYVGNSSMEALEYIQDTVGRSSPVRMTEIL